MLIRVYRTGALWTIVMVMIGILIPSEIDASASYTYDQVGRLTTAIYDNGLCVTYVYDANGNRTSQTNTAPGGAPQTPVWGTGQLGCFNWTP